MTVPNGERETRLYKWVAGVVVPLLVAAIAAGAFQLFWGREDGETIPGPSTPGLSTSGSRDNKLDTGNDVRAIAFSPDGNVLATGGGGDYTARLWKRSTGERIRALVGNGLVEAVAFSPDGKLLATNLGELWNPDTGARVRELACGGWDAAFSPDGKLVAAGGGPRGTVGLCDPTTGQQIRALSLTSTSGVGLAFSPDGKILATNDFKTVQLWNPATGEVISTISSSGSYEVALSRDELAISSGETVRLLNAATGVQDHVLVGHTQAVTDVAFSPDGRLLATASRDHTVQLWNPFTGAHIYTFEGHTDAVWSVAFSPDGNSLASGSRDHTVRLWDIGAFRR